MNEMSPRHFSSEELLKSIQGQDVESSINQIKRILSGMHPSEVAHSLESLPPIERKFLWSLIETQDEGEVIAELHDEIQQELISEISPEELISRLSFPIIFFFHYLVITDELIEILF